MQDRMDAGLSQFSLRLALVVATTASVVVMTELFSDPVRWGCTGVVALAALATASERRRPGGGWWMLLGSGAALSVAGAALAELSDTAGGLVAVIGGALVVIGATIGFPVDAAG
jgi:hypothetical protein